MTLDKEELRATIAETLDVEVAELTDDADFMTDLDVDSLMALEVMVVLERRYQVKLDESMLGEITCLQKAYDLLLERQQVNA
jgi:acyl carrier protein